MTCAFAHQTDSCKLSGNVVPRERRNAWWVCALSVKSLPLFGGERWREVLRPLVPWRRILVLSGRALRDGRRLWKSSSFPRICPSNDPEPFVLALRRQAMASAALNVPC